MKISKSTRSNLDRIASGQTSYQQVLTELRAKYEKEGRVTFVQLAQPVSLGENKARFAAKLWDIHAAALRYGALELVDAAAKLVLRVLYRSGAHGIAEAELLGELVKLRLDGRITVDGEICDLRLKRAHDGYLFLGICVLFDDLLAYAVRAYKANQRRTEQHEVQYRRDPDGSYRGQRHEQQTEDELRREINEAYPQRREAIKL